MTDPTVGSLAQIELQQFRADAYRHALVRAAPRQGWRGFARLLRSLADRCDDRPADGTGPWPKDRGASGRELYGAATSTTNMNEWLA